MSPTRTLTVAVVLVVFLFFSNFFNKRQELKISGIRLSQKFPIINQTGKLLGYDHSYADVYYYRNQILYCIYYNWDSSAQNTLIKSEIRKAIFVFTKGNKLGYYYDKNDFDSSKYLLVDSVLKKQWFNNFGMQPAVLIKIFEGYDKDSSLFNIKYTLKGKEDTLLNGTCDLEFCNKLIDTDFSLAKELDTISKMKLVKMKLTTNSRFIKMYNVTIDKIEQVFSLQEIIITNTNELLQYFEHDRVKNKF